MIIINNNNRNNNNKKILSSNFLFFYFRIFVKIYFKIHFQEQWTNGINRKKTESETDRVMIEWDDNRYQCYHYKLFCTYELSLNTFISL